MEVKKEGSKLIITVDIEEHKPSFDSTTGKSMFRIPQINSSFMAKADDTKVIETLSRIMIKAALKKGSDEM